MSTNFCGVSWMMWEARQREQAHSAAVEELYEQQVHDYHMHLGAKYAEWYRRQTKSALANPSEAP